MVKQVAFIFVIFCIAFAMAQNQNSEISTIIAQQLSGIINRTASESKQSTSSTTVRPTSSATKTSITSCGTDIACYVLKGLTLFLLNPLLFGLKGILVPVLILVRVLLLGVQFLLNIVLGLVLGLLQSVLTTLPLGGTGVQITALLKNVQTLLNQLLPMVSTLLEKLQQLPLLDGI